MMPRLASPALANRLWHCRLSREPSGSRSAVHSKTARYPVKRPLKSGQGAQQSDAWVFVGMNGQHRGPVSKAMLVAFWKRSKLLSQTWVYPANKGFKQGRNMGKIHQQWQGATLHPLHFNFNLPSLSMLHRLHHTAVGVLTLLPCWLISPVQVFCRPWRAAPRSEDKGIRCGQSLEAAWGAVQ